MLYYKIIASCSSAIVSQKPVHILLSLLSGAISGHRSAELISFSPASQGLGVKVSGVQPVPGAPHSGGGTPELNDLHALSYTLTGWSYPRTEDVHVMILVRFLSKSVMNQSAIFFVMPTLQHEGFSWIRCWAFVIETKELV